MLSQRIPVLRSSTSRSGSSSSAIACARALHGSGHPAQGGRGRRAGRSPARQKICFWSGLFVLWAVTDWPMHDIAEERLYWIHMVQHSVLTVVVPPLMLLAIPTWLARLHRR